MKRILVATDGSVGSDRAVDVAAELAKALGASLLVVSVQEPPSRETVDACKTIEDVAESDVPLLLAHNLIGNARARARRAGANDIHHQVETGGDPTEMILKVAKQRGVDIIVVGKRGRGSLAGLLLGSVSQKLVTLAPCNVVVVP